MHTMYIRFLMVEKRGMAWGRGYIKKKLIIGTRRGAAPVQHTRACATRLNHIISSSEMWEEETVYDCSYFMYI